MPERSLETEVQFLKGVGPKLAPLFAKLGMHTVEDVLYSQGAKFRAQFDVNGDGLNDNRDLFALGGALVSEGATQAALTSYTNLLLKRADVELLHFEHCLHHALRFFRVGIAQQLPQLRRHDLPRQAEFVLEPAALNFPAVCGEFFPVRIHFLLRLTAHDERDCLGELVDRSAVEGGELHAVELEGDRHGAPRLAGACFGIARDIALLRILENWLNFMLQKSHDFELPLLIINFRSIVIDF